ncbi:MAG: glutathione S-transferase family protein [Variibacter sp.]|nr:glutathione S-transferase family protein [Variibacter sp.]
MALTLVIGNKNYSSWSLRPWLALKAAGIPFEEKLIPLSQENYKERLLAVSPGGKVPILIDGDIQVWESTAILEYRAERFPSAGLWPQDAGARALARAVVAEMHAGFAALRSECPMNLWRPVKARALSPAALADVARIDAMWSDCRRRFGAGGSFLFGRFGAADAMYAPVASRFETYAVGLSPPARDYVSALLAHPAFLEWKAAGVREPWVLPEDEPDWPTVLKA